MLREVRFVQTNIGDRYREARPKKARYIQINIGDKYREARENIGRNIESQLISDEDLTRQKTSFRGPIEKIGERNSIKINSIRNIIPTRALVEFLKKRKRFIIRPLKPLNKDGARILSIKNINNKIIIFKTYYKAVNDLVYG